MLEDFHQLPQWVVRTAASEANQNAEIRGQVKERFHRESTPTFQVPKEFECDRAFLVDPADAVYVENMNAYLFRGEGRHTMMTDEFGISSFERLTLVSGRWPSRCWPVRGG